MMTSVMMSDDDTVNQDDNYDQNDAIWRLLPESAIFSGHHVQQHQSFYLLEGNKCKTRSSISRCWQNASALFADYICRIGKHARL